MGKAPQCRAGAWCLARAEWIRLNDITEQVRLIAEIIQRSAATGADIKPLIQVTTTLDSVPFPVGPAF